MPLPSGFRVVGGATVSAVDAEPENDTTSPGIPAGFRLRNAEPVKLGIPAGFRVRATSLGAAPRSTSPRATLSDAPDAIGRPKPAPVPGMPRPIAEPAAQANLPTAAPLSAVSVTPPQQPASLSTLAQGLLEQVSPQMGDIVAAVRGEANPGIVRFSTIAGMPAGTVNPMGIVRTVGDVANVVRSGRTGAVLRAIGGGVRSAVTDILPKTAAETIRGGPALVRPEETPLGAFIQSQGEQAQRHSLLSPEERDVVLAKSKVYGEITPGKIEEGLQNLGYSALSMLPGLLVSAKFGPKAGAAVGGVSGAVVGYRATYDQFMQQVLDKARAENPNFNQRDWDAKIKAVRKDAVVSALAEAGFEGIGNALAVALIETPADKIAPAIKAIRRPILRTLARGGVNALKAAADQIVELLSEGATQYVQQRAAYNQGLIPAKDVPKTMGDAIRQVGTQIGVMSLATMGAGGAVSVGAKRLQAVAEKRKAKEAGAKPPPMPGQQPHPIPLSDEEVDALGERPDLMRQMQADLDAGKGEADVLAGIRAGLKTGEVSPPSEGADRGAQGQAATVAAKPKERVYDQEAAQLRAAARDARKDQRYGLYRNAGRTDAQAVQLVLEDLADEAKEAKPDQPVAATKIATQEGRAVNRPIPAAPADIPPEGTRPPASPALPPTPTEPSTTKQARPDTGSAAVMAAGESTVTQQPNKETPDGTVSQRQTDEVGTYEGGQEGAGRPGEGEGVGPGEQGARPSDAGRNGPAAEPGKVALALGIRYDGKQEGSAEPVQFTDTAADSPARGASFNVATDATQADVAAKLAEVRERFRKAAQPPSAPAATVPPKPSPPPAPKEKAIDPTRARMLDVLAAEINHHKTVSPKTAARKTEIRNYVENHTLDAVVAKYPGEVKRIIGYVPERSFEARRFDRVGELIKGGMSRQDAEAQAATESPTPAPPPAPSEKAAELRVSPIVSSTGKNIGVTVERDANPARDAERAEVEAAIARGETVPMETLERFPWLAADEIIKPYVQSLPGMTDKQLKAEEKRVGDELNRWANNTRSIMPDGTLNPALGNRAYFEISNKFTAINREIERRRSQPPAPAPTTPAKPDTAAASKPITPEQAVAQRRKVNLPPGTLRVRAMFKGGRTIIVNADDIGSLADAGEPIVQLIPLQAKDKAVPGKITVAKEKVAAKPSEPPGAAALREKAAKHVTAERKEEPATTRIEPPTTKVEKPTKAVLRPVRTPNGGIGIEVTPVIEKPEVKSPLANLSPEKQARAKALQDKIRSRLLGSAGMGQMFDPEVLTAGAELTALYVEGGTKTFKQFATNVKADMADVWDRIKRYLHGIWTTAAADNPDLDEVSRAEAAAVIDEMDAEAAPTESAFELDDKRRTLRELIASDYNPQLKAIRIRQMAEAEGITLKEMQERIEAEIVRMADEIASSGRDPRVIFDQLRDLYQKQPTLSARTSTSVELQAYSTPAPLAYLASYMVDAQNAASVYEPTAGNGMLLIGLDKGRVTANELDPKRADNLRALGVTDARLTTDDATKHDPGGTFDAMLMNPPFGPLDSTVNVEGYAIKRLDHVIALRALKRLGTNGRAVLILGANREAGRIGEGADRTFLNYIYNNFNVANHFEINGDLYGKQGAKWPIRVVVLDGRRMDVPEQVQDLAPKTVDRLNTWGDALIRAGEVRDALDQKRQGVGAGTESGPAVSAPAGGAAAAQPGTVPQPAGRPARTPGSRGGRQRVTQPAQQPSGQPSVRSTDDSAGATPPVAPGNQPPVASPGGRGEPTGGLAPGSQRTAAESGAAAVGTGREGRGGRTGPSEVHREPPNLVGAKRNEGQREYVPLSKSGRLETLVPSNIAEGIAASLADLHSRADGDIDEWLRKKLGYDSKDELYSALAAEQVDGVALAIDQMERGGAIIVGDDTGIGKGRQAAAVMRWAKQQGYTPVFFTADPKLFTDLYRDIRDIKWGMKPFIIADPGKGTVVDENNNVLFKPPSSARRRIAEMDRVLQDGMETAGYDAVMLPYSQINKENPQQRFLTQLGGNHRLVVIMDEAHQGAGISSMQGLFLRGGQKDLGEGANRRKVQLPGLLNSPGVAGTMYLSATYAKRPENTPLYFKTHLGRAAANMNDLVAALKRGGVALQQSVAEALSKVGQYIRRERDFTGVDFSRKIIGVGRESEIIHTVDQTTSVLRSIREYSDFVRDAVQHGALGHGIRSTAQTQAAIDVTSFASVAHNYVSQMLLAVKVEHVIQEAVEAHRRGEKPVIALMNTMESFLDDHAEQLGLNTGDTTNMTFKDLLVRALDRTMRATEKNPQGNQITTEFRPNNVGLQAEYDAIREDIDALDINLPVSPIDAIAYGLRKAGIRVGEMTGRTSGIRYTADDYSAGVYERRTKADKNTLVNGFNNGDLYDALILNASGSTGLSIHASPMFRERPIKTRNMIIAQPHLDISVVIQTLGRIKRTGMIPNGARYTMPVLPIEAERRPSLVLERKMKSLNANTTAASEGAVRLEQTDFMNKYGDDVIARYLVDDEPGLQDEIDLHPTTDDRGNIRPDEDDYSLVFTGRMALMPNARQKAAYDAITHAYNDYVGYLKDTDQYDLEIKVYDDWDGVQQSDDVLVAGEDESSIFTASTKLQRWEIKDTRHVPTADEMRREFEKKLKDAESVQAKIEAFTDDVTARLDAMLSKVRGDFDALPDSVENRVKRGTMIVRIQNLVTQRDQFSQVTSGILRQIGYGAGEFAHVENTEDHDTSIGMVTDITFPKQPEGYVKSRPGSIVLHLLTNRPGGRLRLPLSLVTTGRYTVQRAYVDEGDVDVHRGGGRYERHVIVGNPIRAITAAGNRGRLVAFKARDGKTINGLLLPMSWTPDQMQADPRADLVNARAVGMWMDQHGSEVKSGDATLEVPYGRASRIRVSVPAARAKGGNIYLDRAIRRVTGDFDKRGNKMVADFDSSDVQKVAQRIMELTTRPFRPSRTRTGSDVIQAVQAINLQAVGRQGRGVHAARGEGDIPLRTPLSRETLDSTLADATRAVPFAAENVTAGSYDDQGGDAAFWRMMAETGEGQAARKRPGEVTLTLYHGTKSAEPFDVFEPAYEANERLAAEHPSDYPKEWRADDARMREMGPLFFFAKDEGDARTYAEGGHVMEVRITGRTQRYENREDAIAALRAGETDIAEFPDTTQAGRGGVTAYVVRDAKRIQIDARFHRSRNGEIRAITYGNKSHFFLDRYENASQLRGDIMEEAGHRLVNELGGQAWRRIGTLTYRGEWADIVAEIRRNYGYAPGTEGFNHELIAKAFRDGKQNVGLLRRFMDAVVSAFKALARRMGLTLNLSDAEVRNELRRMLEAKARGMNRSFENAINQSPQFSRSESTSDTTETPGMKRLREIAARLQTRQPPPRKTVEGVVQAAVRVGQQAGRRDPKALRRAEVAGAVDALDAARDELRAALRETRARVPAGTEPRPAEDSTPRIAKRIDRIRAAIVALRNAAEAAGQKDMRQAVRTVYEVIRDELPLSVRGKAAPALLKIKNAADLTEAMRYVADVVEAQDRRALRNHIIATFDRVTKSPSVNVEFRIMARNYMAGIARNKPTAATRTKLEALRDYLETAAANGVNVTLPRGLVARLSLLTDTPLADMNLDQLRDMAGHLDMLLAAGKTQKATDDKLWNDTKDAKLTEIEAGTTPINTKQAGVIDPENPDSWSQKLRERWAEAQNMLTKWGLWHRPMDVAVDLLDGIKGYSGPNFRTFRAAFNLPFNSYLRERRAFMQLASAKVKEFGIGTREAFRIGIHAVARQEMPNDPEYGRKKLRNVGYSDAQIDAVRLSDNEQAFYDWMTGYLDEMFPRIDAYMKRVWNTKLSKVDFYFPMVTDWSLQHGDPLYEIKADPKGMPIMQANLNGQAITKTVTQDFSKERKGAGEHKVQVNALRVLVKHMDDVLYAVNVGETIKMAQEIASSDRYKAAAGDIGQKWMQKYLTVMARKGGAGAQYTLRALDILRRNVGMGTLGFAPLTMAVQYVSLLDGFALIGPGWGMYGATHILTPKGHRFVYDNMPQVRDRVGDDWAALEGGKMARAAYKGLGAADRITAGAVAMGAYAKWMDEHGLVVDYAKPNQEAIDYAQLMVARTQSSGSFKETPLAVESYGSISKALYQFQSFAMNKFWLIEHDGIATAVKTKDWKRLASVLFWTQAAFLAEEGIRLWYRSLTQAGSYGGGDDEDKAKRLAMMMLQDNLQSVPMFGSFSRAAQYGSSPIPTLAAVSDALKGTMSVMQGATEASRARGAVRAAGAVATAIGVPGARTVATLARSRITSAKERTSAAVQETVRGMGKRPNGARVIAEARRLYRTLRGKGDLDRTTSEAEFVARIKAAVKRRTAQ